MGQAQHLNFYQNIEEAQLRLTGTVVTYDGEPAYIHSVDNHQDGILRLKISILPNNLDEYAEAVDEDDNDVRGPRIVRKKINSPRFDRFRPFKMGYCNYFRQDEQAKFLSRIPSRRSKQGLSAESLGVSGGGRLRLQDVIRDHSFREMVMGEYPGFEEAMDRLDRNRTIGIDREFAIAEDEIGIRFLHHKSEKIGLVRSNEVLLGRSFTYLREVVQACPHLPNVVNNI